VFLAGASTSAFAEDGSADAWRSFPTVTNGAGRMRFDRRKVVAMSVGTLLMPVVMIVGPQILTAMFLAVLVAMPGTSLLAVVR
jgi:hypothetical protein